VLPVAIKVASGNGHVRSNMNAKYTYTYVCVRARNDPFSIYMLFPMLSLINNE